MKYSSITKKFIEHNKNIFLRSKCKEYSRPIVLFEYNEMHSAHIAYSYLANILIKNNRYQIKCYNKNRHHDFFRSILFKLRKLLHFNQYQVYKSFGANELIEINISYAQKNRAKKLFSEIFYQLKTKQDIEELKINNIWIGDLIYDTFLMTFKKPTIEKDSLLFKHFFLASIELFIFWDDYFNHNDVRAVNLSHCVYNLAIPLRIAIQMDIPVFQTNATHVYRLNKENLFAYSDYYRFPESFKALPIEIRKLGTEEAKSRLKRRFDGEAGIDMEYSTKSAFGNSRHERLLKKTSRKKVLIATHCFFDSPHGYGNNIFPDFYEWLDFLGKITEETDYDWYIKTHRDYLPGTKEIVDFFVRKYPRFKLLPTNSSHNQIIAEGIDVALTVFGTIGVEYAALGIPVINASQCNPHIAYDFNIHAKDEDDYRRILLQLDKLDFTVNKQQVYEYYFMRNIYNSENIFFKNYNKTIEEIGGYKQQFTSDIYNKWLDEWSNEKHKSIIAALDLFIKSNDFRMDYRHQGQECPINEIHENSD